MLQSIGQIMHSMGEECLDSLGRVCTREQRILVARKRESIMQQIRERAKVFEKEISGYKDMDKIMEAVRKSMNIVKEVISSNIPGTEGWERTANKKKLAAVEMKWEWLFASIEAAHKMEVQRLNGRAAKREAFLDRAATVIVELQRQNQSLQQQNQRLREENARERARNAEVPIAAETPFAVEVPIAQAVQVGPGEDRQRGRLDELRVPTAERRFTPRPPQGQGPRPGQGLSGNNRASGRRQRP